MLNTSPSAKDQFGSALYLLQCLVARDMAKAGVTQQAIAKFLGIAKAAVGPMVAGIKKERAG